MLEFRLSATLETKTGPQEHRCYVRTIHAPSLTAANDIVLGALDLPDYVDQTETPPVGDPDGKGS